MGAISPMNYELVGCYDILMCLRRMAYVELLRPKLEQQEEFNDKLIAYEAQLAERLNEEISALVNRIKQGVKSKEISDPDIPLEILLYDTDLYKGFI